MRHAFSMHTSRATSRSASMVRRCAAKLPRLLNFSVMRCPSRSLQSLAFVRAQAHAAPRRVQKPPYAARAGIAAGEPRIIRWSRDRSFLAIRRQDEKRAPQSCRQEHWRERILSVVQERPAILAWRMTLTTSFRRPLVVVIHVTSSKNKLL